MKTLAAQELATVRRIIEECKGRPGPLIELLHAIQAELGFIPPEAVPVVAEGLNLSRAEVHGVVTFYHFFRRARPGRSTVSLCQAEACQSMGAAALSEHARQRLGVGFHETTADGRYTLEPVYCLGNCACSPAAMIDGELYGRLTPERFDALLAEDATSS
ncbi:MAG: formate dehydrogenase subunit gamma [Gammaproteobacteria bacterium]|nr:formate dehydrogenase subunit gamma [Gammaproteobacteria bacterium]MBV9620967.1 formate dehydrogenase subunit gamma [Gammaproteobacteria bacterium]